MAALDAWMRYQCRTCAHVFIGYLPQEDDPPKVECPKCNGNMMCTALLPVAMHPSIPRHFLAEAHR